MANIICFKQEKGLKNCSNRQLKVTAKHKIYPDGHKNAHLENRRGVGHCPMCSQIYFKCDMPRLLTYNPNDHDVSENCGKCDHSIYDTQESYSCWVVDPEVHWLRSRGIDFLRGPVDGVVETEIIFIAPCVLLNIFYADYEKIL